MKTYDFKKAKRLIEENRSLIESASLGMHEDWFGLDKLSEAIQKECHDFIDQMLKLRPETKATYADMTNVFLFLKIAQLQQRVYQLEP